MHHILIVLKILVFTYCHTYASHFFIAFVFSSLVHIVSSDDFSPKILLAYFKIRNKYLNIFFILIIKNPKDS